MKKYLFILFYLPSFIFAFPNDQLLLIFGSGGRVLYKVIDFANDHGFRYAKILSYEFEGFGLKVQATCQEPAEAGFLFELKDQTSTVTFLCFETKPKDPQIIDVEKYRFLLD